MEEEEEEMGLEIYMVGLAEIIDVIVCMYCTEYV